MGWGSGDLGMEERWGGGGVGGGGRLGSAEGSLRDPARQPGGGYITHL